MATIPLPFDETAKSLNSNSSAFQINSPKGSIAIMGIADVGGAPADQNPGYGVAGLVQASADALVIPPTAGTEVGAGVCGVSNANSVPGVYGISYASGAAIRGTSASGVAGQFDGAVEINDTKDEDAIVSTSSSANHAAVAGHNGAGGFAFWGASDSTNGTGIYARGQKQAAQFDGAVQVNGDMECTGTLNVGTDIVLMSADCAEEFDVAAGDNADAGSVMVFDDDASLQISSSAYDTRVAGVVSGAGEYRPGLILDKIQSKRKRMPIALMGKAYCKVDAGYGVVKVGDLLTTSPTPGHAMRAADPGRSFGAVIGKAMKGLTYGRALIPVLIALQ